MNWYNGDNSIKEEMIIVYSEEKYYSICRKNYILIEDISTLRKKDVRH